MTHFEPTTPPREHGFALRFSCDGEDSPVREVFYAGVRAALDAADLKAPSGGAPIFVMLHEGPTFKGTLVDVDESQLYVNTDFGSVGILLTKVSAVSL